MPTSVYVVLTNSVEGSDQEFNDWYTKQHLADVTNVPGYVRARRYKLADAQFLGPQTDFKYLAIYEVEGETQDAVDAMANAIKDGMYLSPALAETLHSTFYEPLTDWVAAPSMSGRASTDALAN
ncbi:hypothetical protein M1E17_09925 [Arthrobacter sp. D1-29]